MTRRKRELYDMAKLTTPNGNDTVVTPDDLALVVVNHFVSQIKGTVLEPCSGGGAFLRAFQASGLDNVLSLEIKDGTDFFQFTDHVDWIITNPPWSQMRKWLIHSYEVADDIVLLTTTNHIVGFQARFREMRRAAFGVKEILLVPTPSDPWPWSGFQLGAIHLRKGWNNCCTFNFSHMEAMSRG